MLGLSIRRSVHCLCVALLLASCADDANYEYLDRSGKMTRKDYRDAMQPRPAPQQSETPPPIPTPLAALGAPSELNKAMPLVSISVDENVPLRDVFVELAKQAGADLELDPNITGSVIFTARQRPLPEVVERISRMAGLRSSLKDNILRVSVDTPYHENYRIDYLNVIRNVSSAIGSSVDLTATGGGGGGGSNNSSTAISGESESDFWASIESNLTQILNNSQPGGAVAATALPAPAPIAPSPTTAGAPTAAAGATDAAATAAPAAISTAAPVATSTYFTLNRQAGVVSVYGNEAQHRLVKDYLERVRRSATAQVLIEARVLEVSLNSQFNAGINWRTIFSGDVNFAAPLGRIVANPPFTTSTSATANAATIAVMGDDISTVANLIEQFGTVRTLSSPRLTALQNQTAMLRVASNLVYFTLDVTPIRNDAGLVVDATVTSSPATVPVGLIMAVQPSIDTETNEISLAVRPTITRQTGSVEDPAVRFAVARLANPDPNIRSTIPVLAVQELDSVVKLRSGQVMVMGGLMQDRSTADQNNVPGVSEVPLLGGLFKSHGDNINKTELVIFLRATIIRDGESMIEPVDSNLYNQFGGDRRPLPMPKPGSNEPSISSSVPSAPAIPQPLPLRQP